jgi:Leucine-rich repeat (LRR) protein
MSANASATETQHHKPVVSPGRWGNLAALLLIVPAALFLAVAARTLIAERSIEKKRQEIGRAGGKCRITRDCPRWIKRIAGENFHSFLDRSRIVGVDMTGEKIDDLAVAALRGLTDVDYLSLEDSRVTEKGLEVVAGLKSLTKLNLRNTPVRDFSRLEELPALEMLMVDFSKARDADFGTLARLPRLRQLSASRTQMSDAGVAELSKIKTLEELNISYAMLGEHGLAPLQGHANLKLLVLENSQYNLADLEAFRASVPGCKVVW